MKQGTQQAQEMLWKTFARKGRNNQWKLEGTEVCR